jgi:TolB-like protein/class 3 adenylate cyclase/cytochrome c-type biogenesis protein CcmH/NrfG
VTEIRKLAAIMFTDMVGYSALTQRNEALALALVAEQQRLLRPILAQHDGREVKGTGDGYLVEFASALQAVSCAIDMQRAMVEYNSSAAPERRIQIRIGLHLGDVVVRDGDVFGDGVNIAARIEPLAEAGGICMTRPVHDQVHNKIDVPLVPIGQPQLKNIQVPIDVYRVVLPWMQGMPTGAPRKRAKTARLPAVAAGLATFLVIAGVIIWRYQQPTGTTPQSSPSPVASTPLTHAADRKSVAVLPFVNMSSDKENEYFSDGITEDLITALSKVSGLHVAARTSSFAFKGKNEDVRTIGTQLNVGAVLEGSVAKAGNQVRITAQLINVADGYHLWSDSYDRELQDIFAIRSQVAQTVAKALQVTLAADERQRIEQKPTENLEAYQLYLKGRYYVNRYTEDGLKKGLTYLQQAIALDPGYALAYQGLAYYYSIMSDWFAPQKDAMPKARAAAEKALQIDPTLSEPHTFLAFVAWYFDWNWSAAEEEYKRALALAPNSVVAHQFYGLSLSAARPAREGIAELRKAVDLDPLSPEANSFLGMALYYAHRYAEAIAQFRATLEMEPNYSLAHLWLGNSYVQNGELERGLAEIRRAKELDPHNPDVMSGLGHAYAVAGDRDAAQRVIEELQQQSQANYVSPYYFALIYAALGDTDRAFAFLDRAYEDRGFYIASLKVEPMVDPLRSDPRFTELLKQVGLDT